MSHDLSGRRVLVVEDEMLVAMLLEDMLTDLGCTPVGPAGDIEDALRLVENARFDMAILDVNLNGHGSYPIADALKARGVPFAFATGYGADGVSAGYADAPTLQKPFLQADLARVIQETLS